MPVYRRGIPRSRCDAKKQTADQKKNKETGGGQGTTDLTAQDERLAAIIGHSSLSGICPRNEGESDDFNCIGFCSNTVYPRVSFCGLKHFTHPSIGIVVSR